MSLIAQVMQVAQTTRADVIRVATQGGTTREDWAIAHAIQTVTGRSAYELMYTAGRTADIATIWADSRTDATPVAPTNPNAVHDPTVVIYGENTSPEDTNRIAPHHPGDQTDDNEDDQEQDDRAAAEQLATTVLADLAEILDDAPAAIRLTRAWVTPTEGRLLLHQVLRATPRTRYATPSIAPAA